ITTTGGAIYALAWSPDGSTIAYAATSLVGVNLVRLGGSPERVRESLAPSWRSRGEDLVWSPDGTRLAVTTQRAGVAVVRVDGSGPQGGPARQPPTTQRHPARFPQGAGGPWYSVSSDVSGSSEHIDRLQIDRWIQGR